MDGVEVKVYRFQKGNLLAIIASEDYEEAKMLAEKAFNTDPEGVRIYKKTKARLIYMEDLDELLSFDDVFRMLIQEVEKEKGGLTN